MEPKDPRTLEFAGLFPAFYSALRPVRKNSIVSAPASQVTDSQNDATLEESMQELAVITSQGRARSREVRFALGVKAGDSLLFERDGQGFRVLAVSRESTFSKYRGIGNPGIPSGREGIRRWMLGMRGR